METSELDYDEQKDFQDVQQFEHNAYDFHCGEIFITASRVAVLHCMLCDRKYRNFKSFLKHLAAVHDERIRAEPNEDADDEATTMVNENDDSNDIKLFDNYSLRELSQQPEREAYYSILQLNELSADDIKTELVEIEEEYLDELENTEIESAALINNDSNTDCDDEETLHNEQVQVEITPVKKRMPKSATISMTRVTDPHIDVVFECGECSKKFDSKRKLKKHTLMHSSERKHKCKICGFAFKERSNLNAHVRRHTGQKKIGCDICSKKFFTRNEAETHMRIHTGERPYICSYCGMSFVTSGGLTEHVKRHNNVRPHKCNYCDKSFYDSCQLKDHMPVHTNERPFVCTVCSASFARRKALRVHTKLHINAKEYKCNLCDRSFNQKPGLIAHVKINHKVVNTTDKLKEFSDLHSNKNE